MTRRTRVLHVVESFGGGVFTSVTQIVNHLDPSRFDVGLIYSRRPQTPPAVEAFVRPHVHLVRLDMASAVRPAADLAAIAALVRIFKREQPDVVHLHSSKAGALGRVAARLARVPKVFYSPRGLAFLRTDVGFAARTAYRLAERGAAVFGGTLVACSRGELAAARRVAPRAVLVENAIDVAYLDQFIGRQPTARAGHVTVGISGRVAPQRQPALFVETASRVRETDGDRIRFLWIGGGAVPSVLASAPVEVTGWLSRADALSRVAHDVDVYLHTSAWEGMPLAVLEAMALRKPVVATDVVGNRDIIRHGATGLLGHGAEDLAGHVRALVRDVELRERLAAAGRSHVEQHFSLPVLIAALEALYRNESLAGDCRPEAGDLALPVRERRAEEGRGAR